MGEHAPHIETPTKRHDEQDNEVGTHELVCVTTLAVELPPNDVAPGEYNPPPPPPDPPPQNRPERLVRNVAPMSTYPLAPTMPSHAAVSAPTPTLSPREAPSLNTNKSRDRDATNSRNNSRRKRRIARPRDPGTLGQQRDPSRVFPPSFHSQ